MELYTPFMAQAGATVGDAIQRKRINKLAGSAYMGDSQAMSELMQINPELGIKIQQDKKSQEQNALNQASEKKAESSKVFEKNREYMTGLASQVARFETVEEANQWKITKADEVRADNPELADSIDNPITDEMFKQIKTVYGEAPEAPEAAGGAFAGSGMPAQVSNALVKGATDPEYRKTAEYTRAWDIANKPDIIDTEEGRIPLYPKIDPMFKAPGDTKPEKQEISDIRTVAKQDSKVIKGTEKTKSTADEKVSYGFYNRMMGAEDNIKGLGEFDSSSVWERFRGLTNISSSPELQQYRQAADDWIRAKLRRESGAVIGKDEMDKEYEIYFPRIGDSQEVIDQKIRAREEAERSMKTASGRAYKKDDRGKEQQPALNEADLSVTIDGKKSVFPNVESYNAYKKAIGQ